MGRFGMVANPPLAFATNVAARGLSFVLRPITNSNFNAFTVNLWAECKKYYDPLIKGFPPALN